MTYALALLACTTDEPQEQEELEPSAYIYQAPDAVAPALTEAEVETALSEVVAVLLDLNGAPVVDAYFGAMAGQQGDCPDYYESDGNVYWYDYCYSDDGTSFSGYGFGYLYQDFATEGYLYNGGTVYTVAEVTTGEGYTFSGGGSAQSLRADVDWDAGVHELPHTIWLSTVAGSFAYDGPEAAESWLSQGLTPDLSVAVYEIPENDVYPGYQGRVVQMAGGVGGFLGEVSAAVADEFTVYSGAINLCPAEPLGMLSVRDRDGVWYDVLFDNVDQDTGETMDPDLCDGCGTIYVQGQAMGQACIDTSVLTDWEVSPW